MKTRQTKKTVFKMQVIFRSSGKFIVVIIIFLISQAEK